MLNMSDSVHCSLLLAVTSVAAGHQMVVEGHKTIADRWRLFEEAVEGAGAGDLPQLLWSLKRMTALTH